MRRPARVFTGFSPLPIRWTLPRLLWLIRAMPAGKCRYCEGGVVRSGRVEVDCPVCHGLGATSA